MFVATAPTVYGIETLELQEHRNVLETVATVPTVYGIETKDLMPMACPLGPPVATAPTVYGIETYHFASFANL